MGAVWNWRWDCCFVNVLGGPHVHGDHWPDPNGLANVLCPVEWHGRPICGVVLHALLPRGLLLASHLFLRVLKHSMYVILLFSLCSTDPLFLSVSRYRACDDRHITHGRRGRLRLCFVRWWFDVGLGGLGCDWVELGLVGALLNGWELVVGGSECRDTSSHPCIAHSRGVVVAVLTMEGSHLGILSRVEGDALSHLTRK